MRKVRLREVTREEGAAPGLRAGLSGPEGALCPRLALVPLAAGMSASEGALSCFQPFLRASLISPRRSEVGGRVFMYFSGPKTQRSWQAGGESVYINAPLCGGLWCAVL